MAGTPTWRGASALIETPDSGQYTLGDTNSYTQIRTGTYTDCVAARVYKGTGGTGILTGLSVKSCTITKQRGEIGKMVTVWEESTFGGGSVLPADEFALSPQDLNPSVEVNPVFAPAVANATIMKLVRAAGLVADQDASDAAWQELLSHSGTTAWDLGIVLADFLRKAVQNYYQAAFDYTYTQHFSSLPTVSAGGFVETPTGTLGSTISALGLSCLRKADALDYSNGIYKRTRTWSCAANGSWDAVLYP